MFKLLKIFFIATLLCGFYSCSKEALITDFEKEKFAEEIANMAYNQKSSEEELKLYIKNSEIEFTPEIAEKSLEKVLYLSKYEMEKVNIQYLSKKPELETRNTPCFDALVDDNQEAFIITVGCYGVATVFTLATGGGAGAGLFTCFYGWSIDACS